MKIITTLSDWAYLHMGLAMHESLTETLAEGFRLNYLCIDERTYDKIVEINNPTLIPWRLSDLHNSCPDLKQYRKDSYREFVWMLQVYFTNWFMTQFSPDNLTYISADLCFYADPQLVYNEIASASVGIIRHRHIPETADTIMGRYNTGFVYFAGDKIGRELLNWWTDAVLYRKYPRLATCYDQRYLEGFIEMYPDQVCVADKSFGHSASWHHILFDWSEPGRIGWNGESQLLVFNHFSQIKFDWNKNTYAPTGVMWRRETDNGKVFNQPGLRALYDDYFRRVSAVRLKYAIY